MKHFPQFLFFFKTFTFMAVLFVTSAEAQTGPGDSPAQAELARATAALQEAEQQFNNAQTALVTATAAQETAEQQLATAQITLASATEAQQAAEQVVKQEVQEEADKAAQLATNLQEAEQKLASALTALESATAIRQELEQQLANAKTTETTAQQLVQQAKVQVEGIRQNMSAGIGIKIPGTGAGAGITIPGQRPTVLCDPIDANKTFNQVAECLYKDNPPDTSLPDKLQVSSVFCLGKQTGEVNNALDGNYSTGWTCNEEGRNFPPRSSELTDPMSVRVQGEKVLAQMVIDLGEPKFINEISFSIDTSRARDEFRVMVDNRSYRTSAIQPKPHPINGYAGGTYRINRFFFQRKRNEVGALTGRAVAGQRISVEAIRRPGTLVVGSKVVKASIKIQNISLDFFETKKDVCDRSGFGPVSHNRRISSEEQLLRRDPIFVKVCPPTRNLKGTDYYKFIGVVTPD